MAATPTTPIAIPAFAPPESPLSSEESGEPVLVGTAVVAAPVFAAPVFAAVPVGDAVLSPIVAELAAMFMGMLRVE